MSSARNPGGHTYTEPGTYHVVLSVAGAGGSDSTDIDITVSSPEDTGPARVYACPEYPVRALTCKPGDTLVSPLNTLLTVPPAHIIYVQPVMIVDGFDIGKRAEILVYVWLPQYRTGVILSQSSAILSYKIDFVDFLPDPFDLTGLDGLIFDVYFGYILGDGTIKYNDYRVLVDSASYSGP